MLFRQPNSRLVRAKLTASILIAITVVFGNAQNLVLADDLSNYPQRALLSGAGVVNYGDFTVPKTFEGPLEGTVNFTPKDCVIEVRNRSTEHKFKVNVEVMQFNTQREKRRAGSYSYQLKPGGSSGQTVHLQGSDASGCALILTSWSAVEVDQPKEDSAGEE